MSPITLVSHVAQCKEPACQCKRCGFHPCVGKIPWRRKWQPTPEFLPEKFYGQRSLVGYSPRGRKELDTAEWLKHTHTHTHTHTEYWVEFLVLYSRSLLIIYFIYSSEYMLIPIKSLHLPLLLPNSPHLYGPLFLSLLSFKVIID